MQVHPVTGLASPVKLTSNSALRSVPSVLRNVPFIKDFLYQDSPRLVCDLSTTGLKLNLSASQRESQPSVMMIKEKKKSFDSDIIVS